ncbi:hypothetical protein HGM15179_004885, partial [Zosterops borbonicus]
DAEMCVIFYFIVLFAIENSYSDDFEAAGCGMTLGEQQGLSNQYHFPIAEEKEKVKKSKTGILIENQEY